MPMSVPALSMAVVLHAVTLVAQFETTAGSSSSSAAGVGPPAAAGLLLSVRDFGAVGDGTTDDAASIQRGIDASQQQQRALWFPAGVYVVSKGLVVHCSNPHAHLDAHNTRASRLQGEGQHQVTIRASRPMNSVLTFTSEYTYAQKATTTNGHSLSELTFDGNGLTNFSVHAASMTRSKFHAVSANNATLAGMYIGFGWTNQFVECAFHRNGLVALYLNAAVNSVNVLDCIFESNRGIGILINYGACVPGPDMIRGRNHARQRVVIRMVCGPPLPLSSPAVWQCEDRTACQAAIDRVRPIPHWRAYVCVCVCVCAARGLRFGATRTFTQVGPLFELKSTSCFCLWGVGKPFLPPTPRAQFCPYRGQHHREPRRPGHTRQRRGGPQHQKQLLREGPPPSAALP